MIQILCRRTKNNPCLIGEPGSGACASCKHFGLVWFVRGRRHMSKKRLSTRAVCPGVGKTAICEGLAQRILNQDLPDNLKHCRLFSLDMGVRSLLHRLLLRLERVMRLANRFRIRPL